MNQPTVCAVMLTAARPEYARRAVECFRRQTYPAHRRILLIYDTGEDNEWYDARSDAENEDHIQANPWSGADTDADPLRRSTVGELRNEAIGELSLGDLAPIMIHWDDDDYSHPNRIAEQVALLQSSGADVVGYREMLFWREPEKVRGGRLPPQFYPTYPGEAWLYSNPDPRYCLGTSLCYWRKTWERKPFEATSQGEDLKFWTGLKSIGVSSLFPAYPPIHPCMIARIHSGPNGNTSIMYRPDLMRAIERQGGEWKRAPEWDSYCRSTMEEK